jgi:hypothetical protein
VNKSTSPARTLAASVGNSAPDERLARPFDGDSLDYMKIPTYTDVVTLHRYYIWANKFRTHFDQVAGAAANPDPNPLLWFADEAGL